LDRLFAIDWLPATDETADWSIEGYVAVLEEAVQLLGGRVNLVGDCQGGWLAVVYAGLRPEHVNTLTIGGAPIDTHAGQSAVQDPQSRNGPDCLPGATNSRYTAHLFVSVVVCSAGSTN
jgi:pimeloyl-ACP methyl ester carboxylesterase